MPDNAVRAMTWNVWWRFGPGSSGSTAAGRLSGHPQAPLTAGLQLVDQRIDHIFFRPGREDQHVRVEGVQIVGDPEDGIYPSDHRAVVADLTWRE